MIQAVMVEPGKIVFRDVERPVPGEDQVLIRVRRIGVCGSDVHVFHGQHPYTSYPVIQGHEVSGEVAGVGKAVSGFAPGEAVTFTPQVTCGECFPCRHGMYHICDQLKVMGFQTDGAAQEFFPIAAAKVLKLPENLSIDHGAMIEPVSVGVHAINRAGDVTGKKVLVLGAGTIGNLVGQVARALGAQAVMITDISDEKLEKARQCGLDCTANPLQEDLGEAVTRYFGPDKADLILECVGVQETISQAISHARKGTAIVIVGVFSKKPQVDLGLVQDRELSLLGTLMYQKEDYQTAISLAAAGKLRLDPLITNYIPFREYPQAYQVIEKNPGEVMKVMVTLD